jgi:DNA repair exonuclease SbcCD ATPase subunit
MSNRWLAAVFVVAAAALLAALAWQTHRLAKLQSAGTGLAAETQSLRERAEKAERENTALRALAGVPPAAPAHEAVAPAHRPEKPAADPGQAGVALELRESLKDAHSTIAELEMRIASLEEKLKKTAEENQRLSGEEKELRERVDTTVRLVDAVQTELKSRNDRLLQLELANRSLRESSASASQRATQAAQALREVEEINRRRETYLSNILRRFRELTDLYRALATRLDDARDGAAPAPGELSRIQTTVSMAEEDLKQIASLGAQAARAQAKLGK